MSWVAAAVVGGTVVGGYLSGEAAKDAAATAGDAQSYAAQLSTQEQRRQFDEITKLLSPYAEAAGGSMQSPTQQVASFYQKYLGRMPESDKLKFWMSELNAGTRSMSDIEQEISTGAEARARVLAGKGPAPVQGSLDAQKDLLGLNGPQAQQAAIKMLEQSPQMSAMTKQGENAILQNASATGGLRGGNTQSALAQFRPQLLSQMIESQFANLGGITSIGQNAAALQGNAGMNTANQISQALTQSGSAQAGAALAAGQASANQWNMIPQAVGTFAGLGGFSGGFKGF